MNCYEEKENQKDLFGTSVSEVKEKEEKYTEGRARKEGISEGITLTCDRRGITSLYGDYHPAGKREWK